ncbi:MAG: anti-sigma factor family protein [Egibacteraceae bacterium]
MDGCAGFEELLSAWLDGQIAAADRARISAHLDECPRCRVSLEALARTRALLRSVPVRQVPVGLFSMLAVDLPPDVAQRGRVGGRAVAVFAVLTGLVGGTAFGLGGQPEPAQQRVAVPVDVYAVDHLVRTVGLPLPTPVLGS